MSREEEIKKILQRAIEDRVFPGASVGVIYPNFERSYIAEGAFEFDELSPRVSKDTVYDVASITKILPAFLTLVCVDKGLLSLDDTIV